MKKIFIFLTAFFVFAVALFANDSNKNKPKTFIIDPSASSIAWKAKKVGGGHNGQVLIKEGHFEMDGKYISAGAFAADMTTITSLDLTDEKSNSRLVNHLKSDDFFSSEKFPVSTFAIRKAEQKSGDNYTITGLLTIKGIANEISFPATIKTSKNKITASATITVDRTLYDIKFRSGKFFENLGDKLIYDEFTLEINLVATSPDAL